MVQAIQCFILTCGFLAATHPVNPAAQSLLFKVETEASYDRDQAVLFLAISLYEHTLHF